MKTSEREGLFLPMTTTIEMITSELHKAYDLINKRFFENKLPVVAITIQSESRRKLTMGWCTTKEVWGDKEGKIKLYEINLTPEFLDLDFYETMDTLMHEMVHLSNIVQDVQDVSRNGTYHNANFKKESIRRGFEYDSDTPDKKYGWSFSNLSQSTKDELDRMSINKDVFSIARRKPEFYSQAGESESDNDTKQRPKSFKWECSMCGNSLRTTKPDMNIICGDCKNPFELDSI